MLALSLLLACAPTVPDALARPNALAVAPDGTLYVSDFGHDRIVAFRPDGSVERVFGFEGLGEGALYRVYAMTVDDDGALVVANRRPPDAASRDGHVWEVKRFVDGVETEVHRIGPLGSRAHTMSGIAPLGDHLLVANPGGGKLFELDEAGRDVGTYGGVLERGAAPNAIAADTDGFWVVDQARHRVDRVRPAQGLQRMTLEVDEAGALSFPSSVAVCPGEWLVVSDLGHHQVQRYDREGHWLGAFAPEPAGPDQPAQLLAVAVAPGCERIYVADSKGDRVLVVSPEGETLDVYDTW